MSSVSHHKVRTLFTTSVYQKRLLFDDEGADFRGI
jgi:hypothetical protein